MGTTVAPAYRQAKYKTASSRAIGDHHAETISTAQPTASSSAPNAQPTVKFPITHRLTGQRIDQKNPVAVSFDYDRGPARESSLDGYRPALNRLQQVGNSSPSRHLAAIGIIEIEPDHAAIREVLLQTREITRRQQDPFRPGQLIDRLGVRAARGAEKQCNRDPQIKMHAVGEVFDPPAI